MDFNLFQKFATAGNKILFQYNIEKNSFGFISTAIKDVLELEVEQVYKHPEILLKKVHPDEREAVANRWKELPETRHFCMTIRVSHNNSIKYIHVDARLVQEEKSSEAVLVGMAENVTEEAHYENYLLEYARRKNSVLAIVAHDLKAPLAHIQGAAGLLRDSRQDAPADAEKLFSIIDKASHDCINLIADVLHDEHVKSPVILLKKDRINVPEMVEKILTSFRAVNKQNHQFKVYCNDPKIIAELDEIKFSQIINNLVMNSVKFTPEGGQITVHISREQNELRIVHSDSGIGIPDDLQPLIFDRYNKASRPGLRGEASTGVGLSIVRQIVEVHGGKIWVESKPGAGAAFHVSLPL